MEGPSTRVLKGSASLAPVKVTLRVRPPLPGEVSRGFLTVTNTTISLPNPRMITEDLNYSFDRVWDGDSQEAVFAECADILTGVLNGQNATIFAYGMTGAGKTFTMLGHAANRGIIPHTVQYLLDEAGTQNLNLTLRASFLEIYNEKVYDLHARNDGVQLELREDAQHRITVAGLSEVLVDNYIDFERALENATKNRSTAATKMNEHSSRSHFVTTLTVNVKTALSDGSFKSLFSKLHLIDLAGSEDNKRTGNTGVRMVESGAINKSLFVLGQVVEALNKGQARIPFRDSKMTRFLQDSLGGKAKAMIIACVGPQEEYSTDTHNTLNFAAKSKLIVNRVVVNEEIERSARLSANSAVDRRSDLERIAKRRQGDAHMSSELNFARPKRIRRGDTAQEIDLAGNQTSGNENRWLGNMAIDEQSLDDHIARVAKNKLEELITGLSMFRQQKEPNGKTLLDATNRTESRDSHAKHCETANMVDCLHKRTHKRVSSDADTDVENAEGRLIINLTEVKRSLLEVVNSGDETRIKKLKGIGVKRAQQIVQCWKDSPAGFAQLNDLTKAGFSATFVNNLIENNLGVSVL
ncbi:Kinesin-like protein kif22 [Gonapodya sp. JEL0774]|nr:Kinesin-like protein kif22 [Gonapodya sp. JEL0774]